MYVYCTVLYNISCLTLKWCLSFKRDDRSIDGFDKLRVLSASSCCVLEGFWMLSRCFSRVEFRARTETSASSRRASGSTDLRVDTACCSRAVHSRCSRRRHCASRVCWALIRNRSTSAINPLSDSCDSSAKASFSMAAVSAFSESCSSSSIRFSLFWPSIVKQFSIGFTSWSLKPPLRMCVRVQQFHRKGDYMWNKKTSAYAHRHKFRELPLFY